MLASLSLASGHCPGRSRQPFKPPGVSSSWAEEAPGGQAWAQHCPGTLYGIFATAGPCTEGPPPSPLSAPQGGPVQGALGRGCCCKVPANTCYLLAKCQRKHSSPQPSTSWEWGVVSFPPEGRRRLGTPRVLFGRSCWDTMLLAGRVGLAEVLGRSLLTRLILPPSWLHL